MTSPIRFILLICCFFVYTVDAKELIQDKKLVKGTLANGLTYYIYPNDYPQGEAIYRLFVKSGSVFENEEQKGLAHFLEHMAFNGTVHFPGDAIIRFLSSNGAKFGKDLNAHTSFNETVYKLQLPVDNPNLIDSTLTILADWAGGMLLDSLEIEKERGVILSEWLSKTGPQNDVQQAFLQKLLNGSRYSQRIVIGDTTVIKYCTHQVLRDYYHEWYRPDLMAVAVVGDIDPIQIEQMIHDKFSYLPPPAKKRIPQYKIPDYKDVKVKCMVHESLKKVELNIMQLTNPFPAVQKESDYIGYLQRSLLNRLIKARMGKLSFNNPPYKNGSLELSSFLNTKAVLLASVELMPEKIDSGISTFTSHLEQMFQYGFTKTEIEKEKKKYHNLIKRKAEAKSPTASTTYMNDIYADFFVGNKFVSTQDEYKLFLKYIDRIDSLSLAKQLKNLVRPKQTHYMLTAFDKVADQLPNENKLLSIIAQAKANVSPYKYHFTLPSTLLTTEPVSASIVKSELIPEIEAQMISLSNGAQVVFKQSPIDRNRISLAAFRQGGLYALDSTLYVSGSFAGNIISMSGAGDFSRDALSYYLAGNTASMRFLIDKTRSGLAGTCDRDDIETMFQLMYLKWTSPKIDETVFSQVKSKFIENYQTSNKTEEDQYYRKLSYLLESESYTNRELTDTIVQQELAEESLLPIFHQNFGSADGFTFIIVGDCEFEDIKPFVLSYIGGLPAHQVDTKYRYHRKSTLKDVVKLEERAGNDPKAKVSLMFQQDTITDGYRISGLKGDILKDVIRTKLLQRLREEMGMIYSVSVSSGVAQHPSPLNRKVISFVSSPENADSLIQETMQVLQEMKTAPDSFEKILTDVKSNLIKEMKLNIQSNSFWVSFIRNSLFNNEKDWSYINRYEEIVQNIKPEDLANEIDFYILNSPMIQAILYPKNVEQR